MRSNSAHLLLAHGPNPFMIQLHHREKEREGEKQRDSNRVMEKVRDSDREKKKKQRNMEILLMF